MSSVLQRLRKPSPLKVEDHAQKIQAEATRLVWNTNNVPKGWRDVFAKPMCMRTINLIDHIDRANAIKCTNEAKLQRRKDYIQEALRDLKSMYKLINYMANTLPINWNKFDTLLNLMLDEKEYLQNWLDSTRMIE